MWGVFETIRGWWSSLSREEQRLLIELVAFVVILWRLKRSRTLLENVVKSMEQTLQRRLDAVEDRVDASETAMPEGDRWERIRELWRDMRRRIEFAIGTRIDDGRKLRKYSNLTRHTYAPIIAHLRKDLPLETETAHALESMNERFLSLRRSKQASVADVQQFEQLHARATKELPLAPVED